MTAVPPHPAEHQLATTSDVAEGCALDQARIEPSRHQRWRLPAALALVGAVATVVSVWCVRADRREAMTPKRTWSSGELQLDALVSNCGIELSPRSDVRLLEDAPPLLHLEVAHGTARFDVRYDPRRRIQVSAADIDVRVTGTQLTVTVGGTPRAARVSVQRGSVSLHPRGQERVLLQLHEGESWPRSTTGSSDAAASKVAADAGPNVAPNLDPDVDPDLPPNLPPALGADLAPHSGPGIGPNVGQR